MDVSLNTYKSNIEHTTKLSKLREEDECEEICIFTPDYKIAISMMAIMEPIYGNKLTHRLFTQVYGMMKSKKKIRLQVFNHDEEELRDAIAELPATVKCLYLLNYNTDMANTVFSKMIVEGGM